MSLDDATILNEKIDVSIIIVNYNCLSILDECLSSLLKYSSGFSYEIIVVDNNTTEGSVDSIICKYPDVILIKNLTNRGFAAANNQGLEISRGEFILFLNNDTAFIENSILEVLKFLRENKTESIVGCRLLNSDYTHQDSAEKFYSITNLIGESLFIYLLLPESEWVNKYSINYKITTSPIEVDVVKGAFLMCSSFAATKLGGFDESFFFYSEETDFCFRFKKEIGGKVIYYPLTKIIHIGGVATDQYSWFKFKNLSIGKIKFFQKHLHGFKFLAMIFFFYLGKVLRIPVYFVKGIIKRDKSELIKAYFCLKFLFTYPRNTFKIQK